MPYALDGIKVIDVAINYAGPASSTYLGDQGAEVIKVERRIVGDTSRRGGNTPFLKLNSYAFMALNRGKRSITLDITKPEGQEILRDLARDADVLVENFRPGVMERLGIGYDTLSALNQRLIYGSLTAFGAKGPYADRAGFDRLAQGLAGAMYRRDDEGRPLPNGIWVADWGAPMLMAFGVMLALFARERTGRGQRVETSLMQAAIAMHWFLASQGAPLWLQYSPYVLTTGGSLVLFWVCVRIGHPDRSSFDVTPPWWFRILRVPT